jgi:hypothetical protein
MVGRRGVRLAVGLVSANALFWIIAVGLTKPLDPDYFRERDGRVKWLDGGGVQFNMRTDVDPLLILAERPFLWPLGPNPLAVSLAVVANLPGEIANWKTTEVLGWPRRDGSMGYRRASWYGTLAFAIVSSVQWALVGLAIAFLRGGRWRRNVPAEHAEPAGLGARKE